MFTSEEQLEEPFIRAGAVPGTLPETESIHVFVAWHNAGEIALTVMKKLPELIEAAKHLHSFSGELHVLIADEFLPVTPKNLKQVEKLKEQLTQLLPEDSPIEHIHCHLGMNRD